MQGEVEGRGEGRIGWRGCVGEGDNRLYLILTR